jgi:hypothetical protein
VPSADVLAATTTDASAAASAFTGELTQYVATAILLGIALLEIARDWEELGKRPRLRFGFLLLAVGAGAAMYSTYATARATEISKREALADSEKARAELATTRDVITAQNRELLDRVIELKTSVATEDLRARLADTQHLLERSLTKAPPRSTSRTPESAHPSP